jgi:hypothetical protein
MAFIGSTVPPFRALKSQPAFCSERASVAATRNPLIRKVFAYAVGPRESRFRDKK